MLIRNSFNIFGVFILASCGQSHSTDKAASADISITCDTKVLKVFGTVGGQKIDLEEKVTSWLADFANGAFTQDGIGYFYLKTGINGTSLVGPGSIEVSLKINNKSSLIGEEAAAYGWIDLTGANGPKVGNCETKGFKSTFITYRDTDKSYVYKFRLKEFSKDPYCQNPVLSGDLQFCFHDGPITNVRDD